MLLINLKPIAMKKLILLSLTILFSIQTMAQHMCNDIVHPTQYKKSILKCCINDIKNGNIVVYTKKSKTYEVEAFAINLNGVYFELNNNDLDSIRGNINPYRQYQWDKYEFYKLNFEQAKRTTFKGLFLVVAGAGLTTGGIVLVERNFSFNGSNAAVAGLIMAVAGPGLFIPGIVFTVKGRQNRVYYKNAMEQSIKNKHLSLGITNNGVGLVYNF